MNAHNNIPFASIMNTTFPHTIDKIIGLQTIYELRIRNANREKLADKGKISGSKVLLFLSLLFVCFPEKKYTLSF